MRIDRFAGHAADPAFAQATGPGQASFGQTMLTLERAMWPGAKAGAAAAAAEAMPRRDASTARSPGILDGFPQAGADRLAIASAAVRPDLPSLAEGDTAPPMQGAMPAWTLAPASPSISAPTMPVYPAPFRAAASMPATETDQIRTSASAQPGHREETASNDHVVAAGGLSRAAIVLRFDAPLEQRKALFDAVSAELRKRGLAHRPIVINGTPYTESTRGKP